MTESYLASPFSSSTANITKPPMLRSLSIRQFARVPSQPALPTAPDVPTDFAHTADDLKSISRNLKGVDLQQEYERRMASKMETLRHLFRIGTGPSSSHTMGPRRACGRFIKRFPGTTKVNVTLYGSLASTGKGHLTDVAVLESLTPREVNLIWKPNEELEHHNGMKFEAVDGPRAGQSYICYSIGGGALLDSSTKGGVPGTQSNEVHEIYPYSNFTMILHWVKETGKPLWQYVETYEPPTIWNYLHKVWSTMKAAIKRGLNSAESVLPGILRTPRRARSLFLKARRLAPSCQRNTLVMAYAMAVNEENASGGEVVTAPTCGSCGTIPAVLYYMQTQDGLSDDEVVRALAVAGLLGNLIKANGSISGAECGCQAEIGSACSMAAGALTMIMGGSPFQIGHAAAMAMEHCLGLTCDPCEGLVQIPCIERNGFYATQAFVAAELAILEDGRHPISFDEVVFTMYLTGKALKEEYRETSKAGLAVTHQLDEREDDASLRKKVRTQLIQASLDREGAEARAAKARAASEFDDEDEEDDESSSDPLDEGADLDEKILVGGARSGRQRAKGRAKAKKGQYPRFPFSQFDSSMASMTSDESSATFTPPAHHTLAAATATDSPSLPVPRNIIITSSSASTGSAVPAAAAIPVPTASSLSSAGTPTATMTPTTAALAGAATSPSSHALPDNLPGGMAGLIPDFSAVNPTSFPIQH